MGQEKILPRGALVSAAMPAAAVLEFKSGLFFSFVALSHRFWGDDEQRWR